jgi:hypothetical protein
MKTSKTLLILLASLFLLAGVSCRKNSNECYDEQLYQKHKNDNCPADCPGVTGCDGKTYCNECDALRHGVKLM